eukprot:TRINITY_DN6036_c0_g1_i1.p1 TRINITY_DN6036_c0_g1~~TRINITY_DN6036_c0_g1_i1.p1  ORF type:complete len:141 (+),score=15.12 TRINITY_DN6036_c0_g1_i1:49-423(+)
MVQKFNKGAGMVPREQWRTRSRKSKVQRLHRKKKQSLEKNLEKVENIQYQMERKERDRERMGAGLEVAGHHNLPSEILKPDPKKAPKVRVPQGKRFPDGKLIGFIKPATVRSRLQIIFAVEKDV